MKAKKCVAVMSILILANVMSFGQSTTDIRLAISAAQLAAANSNPTEGAASPGRLGMTADGKLLVVDFSDRNNDELFSVDITTNPPTFRRIVGEAELKAKIDAHNGANPAPSVLTFQSVDVDSDGDIIVLTDGADPEKAFLFSINPETLAITLLSGLDAPPGLSSIEGNRSLAVSGTTAYITLNDRFLSVLGDAIVKIDTHSPDGGTTAAEEFTSNAQLEAIIGVGNDIDVNDIAVNPKTGNLIAINSGRADSNDDILEIDINTGEPRLLVRATDIEADLGTADVGYSSVGADADGTIYLSNAFGPSGDPTDDGIIAIRNPGNGAGEASVLASEAQIIADPDIRDINGMPVTDLRYENSSLVVSGSGTVFVSESRNVRGVISISRVK